MRACLSIGCTVCSLLKLKAATRWLSKFSLKCAASPANTTTPFFGNRTSSDVNEGAPVNLGQALLVIDPTALARNDAYLDPVEIPIACWKIMKCVCPERGASRIRRARRKDGIEIPAELEKQMRELTRP